MGIDEFFDGIVNLIEMSVTIIVLLFKICIAVKVIQFMAGLLILGPFGIVIFLVCMNCVTEITKKR